MTYPKRRPFWCTLWAVFTALIRHWTSLPSPSPTPLTTPPPHPPPPPPPPISPATRGCPSPHTGVTTEHTPGCPLPKSLSTQGVKLSWVNEGRHTRECTHVRTYRRTCMWKRMEVLSHVGNRTCFHIYIHTHFHNHTLLTICFHT